MGVESVVASYVLECILTRVRTQVTEEALCMTSELVGKVYDSQHMTTALSISNMLPVLFAEIILDHSRALSRELRTTILTPFLLRRRRFLKPPRR